MSLNSSGRAYNISAYLRVASLAVSLYDYLENAPAAWRFYKDQFRSRRLTHSSVLFVLLRFTSIAVLVLSNVGFFYGGFTAASCQLFFLLPPSFKVIQGMVSQAILGIRAFNLSRRSRKIGWVLIVLYFTSCVLQWVTTLSQRSAVRDDIYGNCRAFNQIKQLGAWIYYAIAIIYDLSITAISVIFLLKYQLTPTSSVVSQVTKMMLYDGLGYFFVLTAVNILNLIMYRTSHDVQNAAASLGYCVSWIMSQRLLLHISDASRERRIDSFDRAVTLTQNLDSARDVSRAIRSQFEQKSSTGFNLTVPEFDITTMDDNSRSEPVDVQVRIEHTVQLEHVLPRRYELEDYSRSGRSTRDIPRH